MQARYVRNEQTIAQLREQRVKAHIALLQVEIARRDLDRAGVALLGRVAGGLHARLGCGLAVVQQRLEPARVDHRLFVRRHALRVKRARGKAALHQRIVDERHARRGDHAALAILEQ